MVRAPAARPRRGRALRTVSAKREKIFRRLKALLFLIAVVLVLAALVSGVRWGRRVVLARSFPISTFQIELLGKTRASEGVSKDVIRQSLSVKPGQSLLGLNLDHLLARVEAHPWVEKAQIRRVFPGTLSVTASLYQPRATLLLDRLYYVDQVGNVFKVVEPGEPRDLPLITGLSKTYIDENPQEVRRGLVAVLDVAARVENTAGERHYLGFDLNQVSELHLSRLPETWELTLVLMGPLAPQVRLGEWDPETSAKAPGSAAWLQRLERLAQVREMAADEVERAAIVDLRFANRVVLTPHQDRGKSRAFFNSRAIESL